MSFQKFFNILGPRMGEFGKFSLPLTFGRYPTRNVVVNTRFTGYATVFDVSHMGIFETRNKEKLENLLSLNLDKLKENRSRLSVILDNENGRVLDDLIVGNVDNEKFRLVVNANNRNFFRNFDYLEEKNKKIMAIQGDGASRLVEQLLRTDLRDTYFMDNKTISNETLEICRCGYTGEDGFELYSSPEITEHLAEAIFNLSQNNEKILFGGLMERDILRMEASLWLSGTDFSPVVHIPFNALNTPWLIAPSFRKNPKLETGFRFSKFFSNKPIRKGLIFNGSGEPVGFITSSTKSFTLDKFIALGYTNQELELTGIHFINERKGVINRMPIYLETSHFIEPRYYREMKE